ncbi:MAG: ABC transporter substrate-binding protein [Nitrosomonadales bacterium]|nr:ABC transporter substrate-binding protein [Nitrosomonadales bacterium]
MKSLLAALSFLLLSACGGGGWNDPYPAEEQGSSILYTAFTERPKHLDPAQAYSENEYEFLAHIYAPPLQYHYLKRPYQLVPLAASAMPQITHLDKERRPLAPGTPDAHIAYSVYELHIKPGMRYQPHPAFVPDNLKLGEAELDGIHGLADFDKTGTRSVTAADYAYQIKRLVHPQLHTPIAGVMMEYIDGLKEYAGRLQTELQAHPDTFLDLNTIPLPGVEVVNDTTLRITIKGKYPQFAYWLAMPFFAPMPQEAERFYAQPGMKERNLTLDWWPIGSGPYYLSENDPNRRMVLTKNPYYDSEQYPAEGEPGDAAAGLLQDAGKPLPLIDRIVYSLEKETIPYWNKFLQGYYDASGISSDSFDQAVQVSVSGEANVTDGMKEQGITLSTSVSTSTMYTGFNWLDPVVGGNCPDSLSQREMGGERDGCDSADRARKLRRAIAIAVDFEEFISIFANGRGIAAQSPLPPGIFGHRGGCEGLNRYVYDCIGETMEPEAVIPAQAGKRATNGEFRGTAIQSDKNAGFRAKPGMTKPETFRGLPKRKPIEAAKRLLAEAGYPGGVDAETGQPLVIHLDTTASGVGNKSRLDWMRKQFDKIGVQLDVRSTDYNRFQDKIRRGDTQMFYFGWNADYPDPENFFFLLHGPQGKVKYGGENAANYSNPAYDRLFEQMKNMDNGPERQAIINDMQEILRRDSPWLWGFHPKNYVLQHGWLHNIKPNIMANNKLKYWRVDVAQREQKRSEWNRPAHWPLVSGVALFAWFGWWIWRVLKKREG